MTTGTTRATPQERNESALYKVTDEQGRSFHGGNGKWTKDRWRSVRGDIVPCQNGLHLCREQDLLHWLGPVIWRAEYDGAIVEAEDKVVVRKARVTERLDTWNERTARLFAADCAEYALQYATDDIRPTLEAVIYVVRCYAEGAATDAELACSAAAARSAARSAAAAARSAAAAAWSAAESAAAAACSAAAARSAARSDAWSDAWSAARSTLTARLMEYLNGGSAPRTEAGRQLFEDGYSNFNDFLDKIAAIEEQARAEGRQEAAREAKAELSSLSLPLGSTREAAQHERDTALAILDRVAGLNASESPPPLPAHRLGGLIERAIRESRRKNGLLPDGWTLVEMALAYLPQTPTEPSESGQPPEASDE